MKQYLLSVYQPDGPPPPGLLETVLADLDAVNGELKAAGAWVFKAGLHPPSTATVRARRDGEVAHDRRPVRRGQGARRRLHDHRRPPDLDAALALGRAGWRRRPRCRSRCARSRTTPGDDRRRSRSSVSSGRSTGARWPSWSASSATSTLAEEAVQDAFTEAVARWPADGRPPSPAGWIITTARNRAIDRLPPRGARATTGTPRPRCSHAAGRAGARRAPCATTACG